MLKKILLFLICFNLAHSYAQELEWLNHFSSSYEHKGILIDERDNIYLLGNFHNFIQIDSTNTITSSNYPISNYLLKYNSTGKLLLAKELDFGLGLIEKICFDNDENILTVCKYEGWEIRGLTLRKVDTLGTEIFNKGIIGNYNNVSPDVYAKKILTDFSKNIITIGNYDGNVSTPDTSYLTTNSLNMFITKHKSNGDFLWSKSIASNSDNFISSVDIGLKNELYFTGVFRNNVDFDPGIDTFLLSSHGGSDIFILKLDSNGNFIWVEQFGGVGNDYSEDLILKNNNSYIIAGGTDDSISFNNSSIVSINQIDGFVLELDNNFDLNWSHKLFSLGNDFFTEINLDSLGNIYALAIYSDSIKIDDKTFYSNGLHDNVFQKIDSSGELSYSWVFGGDNSLFSSTGEINTKFELDSYNNPHFVGLTSDTFKLKNSDFNFKFISNGAKDAYIFKIDNRDYTSIEKVKNNNLNIYPNPSKSIIYIENYGLLKNSTISIFDFEGKEILNETINENHINIDKLKKGIYFYLIFTEKRNYQGKFIKE